MGVGGIRTGPARLLTAWRCRDRGQSWQPLTRGLPEGAHLTVLREALAVDEVEPCGVHAGTESGQVFYSQYAGETRECLADSLPPVYSVSTARMT